MEKGTKEILESKISQTIIAEVKTCPGVTI